MTREGLGDMARLSKLMCWASGVSLRERSLAFRQRVWHDTSLDTQRTAMSLEVSGSFQRGRCCEWYFLILNSPPCVEKAADVKTGRCSLRQFLLDTAWAAIAVLHSIKSSHLLGPQSTPLIYDNTSSSTLRPRKMHCCLSPSGKII